MFQSLAAAANPMRPLMAMMPTFMHYWTCIHLMNRASGMPNANTAGQQGTLRRLENRLTDRDYAISNHRGTNGNSDYKA